MPADYFAQLHADRTRRVDFIDMTDASADCEICGGMGHVSPDVPRGHPLFGKLVPCQCTAAARARRFQELCGLTEYERSVRLQDIKTVNPDSGTARMVQAAQCFIDSPIGILTIAGTSGNAKSMALWGVVNACLARNIEAVYITYQRLIDHIRDAYSDDDKASRRLDRFQRVQVLAIDEFGHDKIKATDWVLQQEAALIDHRYRFGLAGQLGTVVAMNDHLENLPDHIASRLRDGRNVIVTNNDPDLRPYLRKDF